MTVYVNKSFHTHRYTWTAFVHCNWLYQIARQCISPLIKRRWLFSIKSGPFKFFIVSVFHKISDFFQNVFCCKYHFNCTILFQIWFDMRRYFLSLIKKTKSILSLIVFKNLFKLNSKNKVNLRKKTFKFSVLYFI